MTIPCKPEAGLIIEANALYVLNMKSQGSITWSDLTGKTRVSPISWWVWTWCLEFFGVPLHYFPTLDSWEIMVMYLISPELLCYVGCVYFSRNRQHFGGCEWSVIARESSGFLEEWGSGCKTLFRAEEDSGVMKSGDGGEVFAAFFH